MTLGFCKSIFSLFLLREETGLLHFCRDFSNSFVHHLVVENSPFVTSSWEKSYIPNEELLSEPVQPWTQGI